MAGKKDDGKADETAAAPKKKKMIIIGAVAAVLLAGGTGGGVFMMTKSASAAEAVKAEEVLVPGDVTALDPVSLNLADGYLRIGIALQGVKAEAAGAHGGSSGPDGNKALDLVISHFSGLPMAELSDPAKREAHKLALQEKIVHAYEEKAEDGTMHKTVMGIYFSQFVMQKTR
ncbi:flagellar FliL protein [Kineococcus xinjiangensis]|uniref:Flagellar protein FliL n=1 Tax=Kineococcus xinjiangensis TaxID=512762 RepID=A0A2S6IJW7_9ACTN|nr:flagellar basal body-associated FliL family protein [Kineococcus xinjiangensis]PPK94523.1 flagellar FliL protein [Kineococcus xinjiangensis]